MYLLCFEFVDRPTAFLLCGADLMVDEMEDGQYYVKHFFIKHSWFSRSWKMKDYKCWLHWRVTVVCLITARNVEMRSLCAAGWPPTHSCQLDYNDAVLRVQLITCQARKWGAALIRFTTPCSMTGIFKQLLVLIYG